MKVKKPPKFIPSCQTPKERPTRLSYNRKKALIAAHSSCKKTNLFEHHSTLKQSKVLIISCLGSQFHCPVMKQAIKIRKDVSVLSQFSKKYPNICQKHRTMK